jgi:hypothetical protein
LVLPRGWKTRAIRISERGLSAREDASYSFPQWQQKHPFWKGCDLNRRAKVNSNYIDCAYATFKNVSGKWEGYFDFRHNKGKAEKLFNITLQLFETAKGAYNAGRLRVFVDISLSSRELLYEAGSLMSEQKYMQISRTTGEYERIQQVRKIRKHGSSLFRNLRLFVTFEGWSQIPQKTV